jgi:alkanesulfonate monooxygenase SsuD/methylene tetrahydromethanopterin reductase-like flavin-dependent oxidoreductase (luciferase family)
MRLGMSISSGQHDGATLASPPHMVERARAAYAEGFETLTVGDHHNNTQPHVQAVPMMARLLAEWSGRPAGPLFILPLWHPLMAAEQIATLAAIHDGPLVVQVTSGNGPATFAAMGHKVSERGRRLDGVFPAVQALLAGEVVDAPDLDMTDGRVGLLPATPVEWWVGGRADVALRRAAALGDAWYGGHGLVPADARERSNAYRTFCADVGRPARAVLRRDALVLEDGDEARRIGADIVASGYRGFNGDQLILGNADDASEQLTASLELGFDELAIRCLPSTQSNALETIHQIGSLIDA